MMGSGVRIPLAAPSNVLILLINFRYAALGDLKKSLRGALGAQNVSAPMAIPPEREPRLTHSPGVSALGEKAWAAD
jgi:hypothetical protein